VGIPIVYIDKACGGLIVVAVRGAFYHISIFAAKRNNRARATIFAGATWNGFGYGNISSHEFLGYYDTIGK